MLIARDVDGNTTANINGRSFDVQIDRQARARAAALCAMAGLCSIGSAFCGLRLAHNSVALLLQTCCCMLHSCCLCFLQAHLVSQPDLFCMIGCSFVRPAVVCRVGDSRLLTASDPSPCFQLAFVQLRQALSMRRSSCTAWGRPRPTGPARTRSTSRCASPARAVRRPSRSAAFRRVRAAALHTRNLMLRSTGQGMPRVFEDHWQGMQRRRCCACNLMLVPLARAARWRLPVRHFLSISDDAAPAEGSCVRRAPDCYFCSGVRIGGIPKGRHANSGFSSGPGIVELGILEDRGRSATRLLQLYMCRASTRLWACLLLARMGEFTPLPACPSSACASAFYLDNCLLYICTLI